MLLLIFQYFQNLVKTTHIELFHGPCSHAGILEVHKGTETLVQHSDALNFSVAGKTSRCESMQQDDGK